jgi:hypothetical protein
MPLKNRIVKAATRQGIPDFLTDYITLGQIENIHEKRIYKCNDAGIVDGQDPLKGVIHNGLQKRCITGINPVF